MGDNFKYVAGKNYSLTGSGISSSATSITITAFKDINGNDLAMSDFGTIGYLVLEPKTSKAEIVSFTGVTNNGDGTSTVTGVTRGLAAKAPYTAGGYGQSHSGGAVAIISNPPQFYNSLAGKDDDETITGDWHVPTPATADSIANRAYVDGVAFGALGSATSGSYGTVKLATNSSPVVVATDDPRVPTSSQAAALATSGSPASAANTYVTQTAMQNRAETYAASTGSANAYVLTLSPAPTAYVAGQEVEFKANFANTGAATLNVNSLGAKTIKKLDGATDLASGDIANGQIVKVKYDGTYLQMLSPIATASASKFSNGNTTYDLSTASGTQTIAHGLGKTPKSVRLTFNFLSMNGTTTFMSWTHVYNGTTASGIGVVDNGSSGINLGLASGNTITLQVKSGPAQQAGTVTFDSTNINISWVKFNAPTGTAQILWEAIG